MWQYCQQLRLYCAGDKQKHVKNEYAAMVEWYW